ncbi:potassium-transporting ATPase subunit KdpC [Cytophagales bacterium LB-30]|uniref:Potassium-transporting ATPase KdpC subunit n=1 Tax=Shiella aurantiaca TaxID=3058365 RepID=A0ABT8F5G7_9BACT|nr:potassium-transporting ATPase subunit KdpC [Shiella aurantiaca]MDN4165712.1 potassium-transporting ATPase subunit KdpC [Shiella aurantiaca]
MKSLRIALVLGFSTIILFGVLYPMAMVGIGKAIPHQANGLPIEKDGKLIGFENVGQPFSSSQYFWSRPSAVGYDASSTGGSNLGPTNPDFLALVQGRIDTLIKYHPKLKVEDIPVEMITASGGGLDPHITKQGALIQVSRIAENRGLEVEALNQLVEEHSESPFLGLFGPSDRVNVLKLNLALDELAANQN